MNTKKRLILIVLSFIPSIIAITVFMMRFFYPYHRIIALFFYILGWIPFLLSLHSKKQGTFIQKHKSKIFYSLLSIIILWAILSIFPANNFEILKTDKILLEEKLNSEIPLAENYIEKLHESENKLLNEISEINLATASIEKRNQILILWAEYIQYFSVLDKIIQDNKYFYQISYIKNKELNEKSFILAYSPFVAIYSSSLNILNVTEKIEFVDTLLNEKNIELNLPENSYLIIKKKVADPSNILQTNAGRVYLKIITQKEISELNNKASENYLRLLPFVTTDIQYRLGGAMSYFENKVFIPWFPVQKEVAETIGDTKIPLRTIPLITNQEIQELKKTLEPGDVLIQRRNWYLSNAGLPGFWKHTAIYISNLDELNKYFNETIKTSNITQGKSVSEYIQENLPELYEELKDNNYRTIEAESEGIISFTLEKSLACDYLGVIRPKVSKEEKLRAIIYSAKQFGKPYDFNFDFLTDNSIVCSELYYKAYPQINHNLREVSGRLVLSSNHIVEDFANKSPIQNKLEFITFIDSDETKRISFLSNVSSFAESYKRSSLQTKAL